MAGCGLVRCFGEAVNDADAQQAEPDFIEHGACLGGSRRRLGAAELDTARWAGAFAVFPNRFAGDHDAVELGPIEWGGNIGRVGRGDEGQVGDAVAIDVAT